MRKSAVILSFFLIAFVSFSQEKTTKPACFRVSSFSTSLGFSGAFTSNTRSDYYTLKSVAEDPGIFVDISDMKDNGGSWGYSGMYPMEGFYYSGGGSGNGNLLVNLGLTPYSKKLGKYRENRELRLSLGGSFGTRNNFFYYDNNFTPVDTFQSVSGGGYVFADSLVSRHYNYTLNFTEVNFGLSYLFKTDVNRVVHFYAGAGLNYGITLNATVDLNEDSYRSLYYYNENNKPSDDDSFYYYGEDYESSFNSTKTKLTGPMMFARVYIPMGVSIRLSKKPTSFFNHVNLYAELDPGVEFQFLAGEKTYANPYVGVGLIGVRYNW